MATLRQLRVPLADIKAITGLDPGAAAQRIADYEATAEVEHAARRDLAGLLINRLNGRDSATYEVETREMPRRSLLCLKRNVDGQAGAWTLGKEFVGLFKEHPVPRVEGRAGAAFCIYWGEVSRPRLSPRPSPNYHFARTRRTKRHTSVSVRTNR